MTKSSRVIMKQLRMARGWREIVLSPLGHGRLKLRARAILTEESVDDFEVMDEILWITRSLLVEDIVEELAFIGVDHYDAGGEALIPSYLGHELH